MSELKIQFEYFTYPKLTYPLGELPRDKRAQACWYFYTIAHQAMVTIGNSTEDQFGLLEGNLWMDKRYWNQAKAVALMYGLESPDEFAKFWKYVKRQAKALNLPEPEQQYMRPMPPRIL